MSSRPSQPASFVVDGHSIAAPPLAPGLYVVATPIGNLGDITLRALRTLAGAERILCEDTRVTARLLNHYAIARPLKALHDHNEAGAVPGLIEALRGGAALALCSDAGTPLVSDPGFSLVRAAREAGLPVFAIPGPSAPVAALSVAGLPSDAVLFAGFLPPKSAARRERLSRLAGVPATLCFLEGPSRLGAMLADVAAVCGEARLVAVARELTKLHEEVVRGPAGALAERYAAEPPRGEIVVLVEPAGEAEVGDPATLLAELLTRMSVSRAAAEAAALTGRPRRDLYALALELSGKAGEEG